MDNGWSDIGYHKVVYLDGSVHDGRPMTKVGAHVKGHNTNTLGYCYIGGVAKDGKTAKDTRTPEQKVTMERLTREAVRDYGVTKVSGHNQYSTKACPSFNVRSDIGLKGKPKAHWIGRVILAIIGAVVALFVYKKRK